ncbi:MAG TPA: complex I subunit 1 family protein [Polyangiaceae bacterium]
MSILAALLWLAKLLALWVLKPFFVVMFAMNVAVILTWADRRQGAMIQDRVGPNRAVAWLPTRWAQAFVVLPALGVVAAIGFMLVKLEPAPEVRATRAMLFCQLGILFTWLTGVFIAGRVQVRGVRSSFDAWMHSLGDPRRIFYGGLAAHVLTLFVAVTFEGAAAEQLTDIQYGGGAGLLIFAILFGAGYAAFSIRNEPRIGLRLAGLLHPAADGLKTIFKEDFIPPNADRMLHSIAPFISFFPALVVMAVIPFGDSLCFSGVSSKDFGELLPLMPANGVCPGVQYPLQVVSVDVGLLYFFALAGTGIVGAALAGWASDNKYSLLGGLRAASQMVSYEVTMGLTLVGAVMIYGSLRVDDMILWQRDHAWGIFVQPFAFFLFFAAAVAESKRIPFDIPEGESEIVAGYFTEYSGMKFAMFFFAEYIAVVTSSGLMSALFLGGWDLPYLRPDGLHVTFGGNQMFELALPHVLVVVVGALGFVLKTITLCWLQLMIRWTLPRFRYDQLMRLGWRKLLPASLANVFVTGLLVLGVASAGITVGRFVDLLGDCSRAFVALGGIAGFVYFVAFLLKPVHKKQTLATSSAQFAASAGGTRSVRMGA